MPNFVKLVGLLLVQTAGRFNAHNNKHNEYYLTDIFNFIDKNFIDLVYLENKYEVMGVNTPEQLKELEY